MEISRVFQKIRDQMHKEGKTEEEAKAQYEMDVFNLMIESNVPKPMFTMTNKDGREISYPNIDSFDNKTYDYILKRMESTNNPLLKARYAHVLWLGPKKHGKFAEVAIDSYLNLAEIYEKKDKEEPNGLFGLDVIDSIKNAFILAVNIKDGTRIDITKQKIQSLIINYNPDSSSLFALRANLIGLMLKYGKTFDGADFQGLNTLCVEYAKELQDPHKAISILELGGKVDEKLGASIANWRQLIAERYENMMNSSIEKNKLVAIHFCELALKYYREIKKEDKIVALEKIYDTLKNEAEFKEISVPIDLTAHVKKCEEAATKMAIHSSEDIIKFLISEKSLIPKFADVEKLAEEISKGHLASVIPHVILDERGHVEQHFSTEEELKFFQTLQQYEMVLRVQYAPLINSILIEAVRAKKLDFKVVIDFFTKYAWFGKDLVRKSQNRDVPYNWLNLLAPALQEYFSQMNYLLLSGNRPNFVLSFESLILKIEGLLRDLANLSGVTTFVQKLDNKGRAIYQEKDLTALLHDDKLGVLMGEDDLFFLKFVLVEKAGYNLRHRTAHSLLFFGEYGLYYMNLLFMILLRISKFDFKKAEQPNEQAKESAST
jgi:hypothetical protein